MSTKCQPRGQASYVNVEIKFLSSRNEYDDVMDFTAEIQNNLIFECSIRRIYYTNSKLWILGDSFVYSNVVGIRVVNVCQQQGWVWEVKQTQILVNVNCECPLCYGDSPAPVTKLSAKTVRVSKMGK